MLIVVDLHDHHILYSNPFLYLLLIKTWPGVSSSLILTRSTDSLSQAPVRRVTSHRGVYIRAMFGCGYVISTTSSDSSRMMFEVARQIHENYYVLVDVTLVVTLVSVIK